MKHMLALALLALIAFAPMASAQPGGGLNLPVVGTVTGTQTGTFAGNFNLQRFAVENGQLTAVGTLTGTVTDAAGNIVQTIAGAVTGLVTPGTGTCEILNLTIGPINLNLLGLVVQTNQINLRIAAQPGPGNLLGNLLCAIANLLNPQPATPLQQLVGLLNNLLRQLGNL